MLLDKFGQQSMFCGSNDFVKQEIWKILGSILCLVGMTSLHQRLLAEFVQQSALHRYEDSASKYPR